jgi:AcrR family transcriptional regulator
MKRKEIIFAKALELATLHGVNTLTRDELAAQAGVASGLINYYFGPMPQLRQAIVAAAIKERNMALLATVMFNPIPGQPPIPLELRRDILASIPTA